MVDYARGTKENPIPSSCVVIRRFVDTRDDDTKEFEYGLIKTKKRGKWEFPGGKQDPGESPEDAAIRECFEETGHKPHAVELLTVTQHRLPGGLWYKCSIFLDGTPDNVPIHIQSSAEGEVAWMMDSVLTDRFNRSVITALNHGLKMVPFSILE
jgi:8-oxo-dGTP pyrophosphatase MutT (NUDIX family)